MDGNGDGNVLGLELAPDIDGSALGFSLVTLVGGLDAAKVGAKEGDIVGANVGCVEVAIDGELDVDTLGE